MSVSTLRKKFLSQKNLSGGESGFSLNGGVRNLGYIGQDMRGRSLVRSYSRNGALKGHGGCCGKYNLSEIKVSSDMCQLNDPTVIKTSSVNTTGMIMSKYRWIRRPYPYSSVKPDFNQHLNNQSDYIKNLVKKTEKDVADCNEILPTTQIATSGCRHVNSCTNIAKPESDYVAITGSEYIRSLNRKCAGLDIIYVPRDSKSTPFSC